MGGNNVKVFVTGSRGMMGQDLVPLIRLQGYDLHCVDVEDLDITRESDVHKAIESCMPDLVINCAAYTAVDKAEQERDRAFAVNRDGAGFVAEACASHQIPLIHISTDYVFDGQIKRPYLEDDPIHPLNVYGLSKWEGEQLIRSCNKKHMIIRSSWLFGVYGHNFVKTILSQAGEKDELRIVADQTGCPTWTVDLGRAVSRIAETLLKSENETLWGTYHYCGKGPVTWYDFATRIVEEMERRGQSKSIRVTPIRTSDYPTAANRPPWSVLDCAKIERAFSIQPKPWLKCLDNVLDTLLPSATVL